MSEVLYTRHARQRLRQRGRREQDVNLILRYGTAVKGGGIVLLEKDVSRAIGEFRKISTST